MAIMTPYFDRDGVTLYHGDCLEVLPTLADASVDAVITDPPYNVGLRYSVADDNRSDYAEWCSAWMAHLRRISGGPIAISIGQSNLSMWARIAPPNWWLAWWKPAAMGRCVAGFNNWEPIALYGRPRKAMCDVIRATIRPAPDLAGHPCPKPLEWATVQIEKLSDPGSTILDGFTGSGTTGVAAIKLGRKFIGIELDERYCEIAAKRIEAELSKTALFA